MTSQPFLTESQAWRKISRTKHFLKGLCAEIGELYWSGRISRKVCFKMDGSIFILKKHKGAYIWPKGKADAKRRKLAALFAARKYAEARKFVKDNP